MSNRITARGTYTGEGVLGPRPDKSGARAASQRAGEYSIRGVDTVSLPYQSHGKRKAIDFVFTGFDGGFHHEHEIGNSKSDIGQYHHGHAE